MIKAIIFDWIDTIYQRNSGLFPESRQILEEFSKKYMLGLVSKRKDPKQGYGEIDELNISKYFGSIVIARRKTPIEFRKCLSELSVNPKETLVVGDRTIREIRIGNQMGCQTYWIEAGEHAHEKPDKKTGQPTKIIHSIGDLLKEKL